MRSRRTCRRSWTTFSNPKSAHYRQFISPDAVGERYGLPSAQVARVAEYLGQYGLAVTDVGREPRWPSSLAARFAQAEQAFHTTIRSYTVDPRDGNEPGEFIAPSALVRLPARPGH